MPDERQDRLKALRDRLFNTRLLSAFRMGPAEMDRYLRFLRRFRPRHVFGYPSSIELLCRFARKRGVPLDDLGVRAVFVTAEVLLEPQRRAISEAFGCPVANGYGGRDGGFIAHECPAGGMHLTEDILVEVATVVTSSDSRSSGITERSSVFRNSPPAAALVASVYTGLPGL